MIDYKNPKVELLPNPVGIDFAIQEIQISLANIPWLQKAFGRATKQLKQEIVGNKKSNIIYPEVYNKREPVSVMVNDNLKSYCFFHAIDPVSFDAAEEGFGEQIARQDVSIIFWVNLKKVDPSKEYNFVEELRLDVIKKLKFSRFIIKESFLEYEQIFKPFTITDAYRQYLKPPFAGFRINGEIAFDYFKC